jgi:hypothetical protein
LFIDCKYELGAASDEGTGVRLDRLFCDFNIFRIGRKIVGNEEVPLIVDIVFQLSRFEAEKLHGNSRQTASSAQRRKRGCQNERG